MTLLGLLDMSAAFDTVDQAILLDRLYTSFGISGTILCSIESNASYSDRLSILGLRSLQLRRLHQDLIYTYKIIFGWWIWIAPSSSLSAQTKQHVGMLVNCLYVRVAWMLESTFLETVLLKFGIACKQQWKTLQAYESLNPLSSVLTCLSM